MEDVPFPSDTQADIGARLSDSEVWEIVDELLVNCLTPDLVEEHIGTGYNVGLTALEIKRRLTHPEELDALNVFIRWGVSITETVGVEHIPKSIENTLRPRPTQTVHQFASNQALLVVACFIANELDAYLSGKYHNGQRIFNLTDQLAIEQLEH